MIGDEAVAEERGDEEEESSVGLASTWHRMGYTQLIDIKVKRNIVKHNCYKNVIY